MIDLGQIVQKSRARVVRAFPPKPLVWWARWRIGACLWAQRLIGKLAPPPELDAQNERGNWAFFEAGGMRFGEPCWTVRARRGGFEIGWIEWSPQWRAYRFRPQADAVFNGQLLAEVYVFLQRKGHEVGRFV